MGPVDMEHLSEGRMVRPDHEPGPLGIRTQKKEGTDDGEALFLGRAVLLFRILDGAAPVPDRT